MKSTVRLIICHLTLLIRQRKKCHAQSDTRWEKPPSRTPDKTGLTYRLTGVAEASSRGAVRLTGAAEASFRGAVRLTKVAEASSQGVVRLTGVAEASLRPAVRLTSTHGGVTR